MTISKALLLNVGVFEAHDSVRKSRGAYSLNYRNATNDQARVESDVLGGAVFTHSSANPTAVTMIRIVGAGPVLVSVTLGPVLGMRTVDEVVTLRVTQFLVLDDNVRSITVTNQGLATILVSITQG